MGTIDKSVSIKWNIIRAFGILLIVWSLFSILEANGLTQTNIAYDNFCSRDISQDTRIAWCIRSKYLQALGFVENGGTTNLNEITVDGLKFRRDEQTLFVENQPLQVGERYDVVRKNPFRNPWLRLTTRYVIVNNGFNLPEPSMSGIDALYITGDVNEGWQPNPLGLIILVGGIALVILGNRGMKRTNIARGEYVMVPLNIKASDIELGFFGWVIFSNLVFLLLILPIMALAVNPMFLIGLNWLAVVIAILVLFARKKIWIGAGFVIAVIINAVLLWIFILPSLLEVISDVGIPFLYTFFILWIPLPLGLLLLWG